MQHISEITNSARSDPFGLDELYAKFSSPSAPVPSTNVFNVFNPQFAEVLNFEWLAAQFVNDTSVTRSDLENFVDTGLIRAWPVSSGSFGFTLYSPEEAKLIKRWQISSNYGAAELKEIAQAWNSDLDGTLEVLPHDDMDGSELKHLRRRVAEFIQETERQREFLPKNPFLKEDAKEKQMAHLGAECQRWRDFADRLSTLTEATCTAKWKERIDRQLFRMRFIDEFVRIGNAAKFRSMITQGFSPVFLFESYTQSGLDEVEFGKEWHWTLQGFHAARARGSASPLKTPDFEISEKGILLNARTVPKQFEEIYERYSMEDMLSKIAEFGDELWHPKAIPPDHGICFECNAIFSRSVSTKQYCSDKCRLRVKRRRWREKDPERARLCQARYWKAYHDES